MSELLQPVQLEDFDAVIELAGRSYPKRIRGNVAASLEGHRQFRQAGLDDTAQMFKVTTNGAIVGVCGLCKFGEMCPEDVIWATYFFVDPAQRNTTLAYRMGVALIEKAKQYGYRLFCIDSTNNHPDYFNIEPYLLRFGFRADGALLNYYEDGVNLLFLTLDLSTWQLHHKRAQK